MELKASVESLRFLKSDSEPVKWTCRSSLVKSSPPTNSELSDSMAEKKLSGKNHRRRPDAHFLLFGN